MKKTTKIILTGLTLIMITLVANKKTLAQSVVGLTAIPPRVQTLQTDPGQVVTQTIKLQNQGDSELAIEAKLLDFIVDNNQGRPLFLLDDQPANNQWAMSDWTTVSPSKFVIKAGEKKEMDLVIVVPEDATPGGHYVAITYQPITEQSQSQEAKIVPSVATLVYLIVNGDIVEDASVKRITIAKFSEYGPIDLETEIQNNSDIHIKPQGVVRIHNWFNRLATTLALEEKNIFPGQSRVYQNNWGRKWLFGRYKATLEAAYGNSGNALLATVYFWVIPWKIILILVLFITLIVLTTVYLSKKKKVVIEESTQIEEK